MANEAAAVAVKFSAAHAPKVALKLLLTAATSGHEAAVQTLASCTPVQQCLDAATVENMIAQFIESSNPDGFDFICELPAVLQLDSAAVVRLLQAALQKDLEWIAGSLLEFPAAEQFSTDMVSQVLQAVIECRVTQPD
jgi:hypothetical protein